MEPTRDLIMATLAQIATPGGGTLVGDDLIRALVVESGSVRFVIESPSADHARSLGPVQQAAEAALRALPGVTSVQIVLTAHGPTAKPAPAAKPAAAEPPSLKVGGHPTPHQGGPARVSGVDRIIAVASGK
ncbi:MAG: iron-sulfur cluster assembly protein, partial [Pseudomonadota bacterium]